MQKGMGIISYVKLYELRGMHNPKTLALARLMGDHLIKEYLSNDHSHCNAILPLRPYAYDILTTLYAKTTLSMMLRQGACHRGLLEKRIAKWDTAFVTYKNRFALILFLAVVSSSVLISLAFHPGWNQSLSSNRALILVLLVLCLTPVYPLWRRAKQHPQALSGHVVLIVALAFTFVEVMASYVLHLSGPWVTLLEKITKFLVITACVLFILRAFLSRNKAK